MKLEVKQQTNKQDGGNTMIKKLRQQLKNEKGLTLIELLAVIVILAIIAAIAIPAIGNIIANSKYNAVKSDALNILNAAQLHKMDNGGQGEVKIVGTEEDTIQGGGYLESVGTFTGGTVDTTGAVLKIKNGIAKVDGTVITINATIDQINEDKQKGKDVLKKETATIPKETKDPSENK